MMKTRARSSKTKIWKFTFTVLVPQWNAERKVYGVEKSHFTDLV